MNINVLDPSQFPSWDDTPLWVHFRAIDKDGSMWWFEDTPVSDDGEWLMPKKDHLYRLECAGYTNVDMRETWHSTLEERPELPNGKLT